MKKRVLLKSSFLLCAILSIILLPSNVFADKGFLTAVNYSVGTNPRSITQGDFNGDTYLDLAVVNEEGSNFISILLGNGDGTFDTAVNYSVENYPSSITSGDFNDDTYLDLAVADYGSGNVSILLGNGDGTFDTAVNYSVGTNPRSITSGDFNDDTYLDLAVADYSSGNVSILLGNGDGTFDTAVNYSVGTNPRSITSGDFNDDTYLDLAVVNEGSNNVSILLGNGDGTFDTAVNYSVGTYPHFITQGDFNGDTYLDLAVTNVSSNTVSILLNARPLFAGGTGTEEDPFQISTCQQLQGLNYDDGSNTYPYLTGNYHFILNNDIDCSATTTWNDGAGFMPIGYTYDNDGQVDYGSQFVGSFNGNNHTISGLYINRPTYNSVGLFGDVGGSEELGAIIKNLIISNADITVLSNGGILAGQVSYTSISNCHTSGSITATTEIPSEATSGGILGAAENSEISNSSSSAQVEGIMAGGLVGGSESSNFENVYATGDVTSSFVSGGLIGFSRGGSMYNSYATGDVTGAVSGGLAGFGWSFQIFNSYSVSDLTSVNSPLIYALFNVELENITGGLVGGFVYSQSGDLISNYINNSGWYKSEANSGLSGIGGYGYQGEMGLILEGSNAEVTYSETDNTVFYSKSHGVYDQGGENAWGFSGNPWYEYSNDYPKFTEQEQPEPSHRSHTHSSGSSRSVISNFYKQQIQNATATGVDTTPYTQALNNLNQLSQASNPTISDTTHRTLKLKMTGDDVKTLQAYLNNHNYPLSSTGVGSLGKETTYFGTLTKQAVIKFQLANSLVGDGIVGPKTWAKIDSIK